MNQYQKKYRASERGKRITKAISDKSRSKHKDKRNAHNREYRRTHKGQIHRDWFVRNLILKFDVLSHYSEGSPECAICGEERLDCLSIDHILGGGNIHKKTTVGGGGSKLYAWLKRNNYPTGFRVLCMNDQFLEWRIIKNATYKADQ